MSSHVGEVDSTYTKFQKRWKTCRDVIEGKDDVFTGKETYLARLSGQDDDEYKAYQVRAGWYGATDRTKQALKGMIFRKPPEIKKESDAFDDFIEDATLSGDSLESLANMITDEVLETGRMGILVDHQRRPDRNLSAAEAEQMNLRPYLQVYKAEDILGFRKETINNKNMVTQIRLRETTQVEGDDEFDNDTLHRIRVLEIVDGLYQQRVFEQGEEDGHYDHTETIQPRKNGQRFNYIPFYFVGVQDLDPSYDKPPLLDLAEVNLDYYRTKADYKHGLHFTGLPTAIIKGHRPENEGTEFRIGSTTAWVFPEADADAKYLEFTGQGLSELAGELKELKNDMAALGARMLATEKRQAEAAESHMIKRSGEHSLLASIANNISEALTTACQEAADWMGAAGEISVHLNTDFIPIEMTTKEVLELWQVVQAGGMLMDDFLYNLRQGERLNPNVDDDERMNQLQTEPPMGM